MIVHLTETVWAEGPADELGVFTGLYMSTFCIHMNSVKAKFSHDMLINKIADEFKSVKVEQIQKEGESSEDADKSDCPLHPSSGKNGEV